MKRIILIVFSCVMISCSKSVFYVYNTTANKDYYSYCTLEITRKKEIIYRAASSEYWYYSNPNNSYIYIYSDKNSTEIDKDRYCFVSKLPADISYIRSGTEPKFEHLLVYFDHIESSIFYNRYDNDTIYSAADNDFDYLKRGYGFKENGINWFPPYMVKTDRIDYAKFGKKIQHLNLKNPKKNKRKK